jgi:hypothetical protein
VNGVDLRQNCCGDVERRGRGDWSRSGEVWVENSRWEVMYGENAGRVLEIDLAAELLRAFLTSLENMGEWSRYGWNVGVLNRWVERL